MIHLVRISPRRWIYFGHEDEVPEAKVFEPFWFIESDAPHRVGNGWRMKETHDVAFHVGIAVKIPALSTDLEVLGGTVMQAPASEIGLWGAQSEADDAGEGATAAGEAEHARAADVH